uniref:RNA-dependent RNA polymerase n=1 Tax=Bremia lactucae associated fusagravirus 2 TaxID=2719800 RepID=A0A6G9ELG7_9VIRU|nr:MAG: RNA-dependent RNA polymerase [Bremia lactucae associated fusagravirus 2]
MHSIGHAFDQSERGISFDRSRDLGSRPDGTLYSTSGHEGRLGPSGAQGQVVDAVATPVLPACNNAQMVPTQLAAYTVDADFGKRIAWDSYSFEALDRRAKITTSGGYGYNGEFVRHVDMALPERINLNATCILGGQLSATFGIVRGSPTLPLRQITTRPEPPRRDTRPYFAEAEVLQEVEDGGSVAQATLKTFNHVLSSHRYFGMQGSVFKEEWKVAEADRVRRMSLLTRLTSHGHLYVRMFYKLVSMYYSALVREEYSPVGVGDHTSFPGPQHPAAGTPRVEWADSFPPRLSAEVEVYAVAARIAAVQNQVHADIEPGFHIYDIVGGGLYRYDNRVAMLTDWGNWATPTAQVAAVNVAGVLSDLRRFGKVSARGVTKVEPKDLPEVTIGGEDALWDEFLLIHERQRFLIDAEGVPPTALAVWMVALAARSRISARNVVVSTVQRHFVPGAESTTWGVDYAKVYIHTGCQHAEEAKRAFESIPYTGRVNAVHALRSHVILDSIRWLVIKTGAEADLVQAVELADMTSAGTASASVRGVAAQFDTAFTGLMVGSSLRLPFDATLPAYLYPFRVNAQLLSETEEWFGLRANMRLNMMYYTHIMLSNAFGWASYSSSAEGGCFNLTATGLAGTAAAQQRHGRELLSRRGEYTLSLHDRMIMSCCAHAYGWSPSKAALLSIQPERIMRSSIVARDDRSFHEFWRVHTVPHAESFYNELWLVKKIPDYAVLPMPRGTVKWPEDKARPVVDSAADASEVRVGATMAPFDYKYWLADGGQAFSLQYYVAANGAVGTVTQADRFSVAGEGVRLGVWRKPVQARWPAAPATLSLADRGGCRLTGELTDYIDPYMFSMYNHAHKLPNAYGVQRYSGAAVLTGPSRSWFQLSQGACDIVPTLTYEAPSWAIREAEPIADYYLAALVDPLEGKFTGFHWASVGAMKPGNQGSREQSSASLASHGLSPIKTTSALANDNDPHMPRGKVGKTTPAGKRLRAQLRAAREISEAPSKKVSFLAQQRFGSTDFEPEESPVVDAGGKLSMEQEEPEAQLITPNAGGDYVTADGKLVRSVRVMQSGGNASRLRDVRGKPTRTVKGRVMGGAGADTPARASIERTTREKASDIADAFGAMAKSPLKTARRTGAALRESLRAAGSKGAESFMTSILAAERPEAGLTRSNRKIVAASISEGLEAGTLSYQDVGLIVNRLPGLRSELPSGVTARLPVPKVLEREAVEVEVISPTGVDKIVNREVELTDTAAYEAQGALQREAADWARPSIEPGRGESVGAALKEEGAPRLPILKEIESEPAPLN